jgi:beta-D-galactosyl-(1->4)-L-rhamnose phosphorylase
LESLSGLPFEVSFLSFDEIKNGIPNDIDIIINAGNAGDAWSGGSCWADKRIIEVLTEWVYKGGVFFGLGEPSAYEGGSRFLRMAHVLGVDIDRGEYACHGKWDFELTKIEGLLPERAGFANSAGFSGRGSVVLIDGSTQVLYAQDGVPVLTYNRFGNGAGLYCYEFIFGSESARFLQDLILFTTEGNIKPEGVTDNPSVECAFYTGLNEAVFINNSLTRQKASAELNGYTYSAELEPLEMKVITSKFAFNQCSIAAKTVI